MSRAPSRLLGMMTRARPPGPPPLARLAAIRPPPVPPVLQNIPVVKLPQIAQDMANNAEWRDRMLDSIRSNDPTDFSALKALKECTGFCFSSLYEAIRTAIGNGTLPELEDMLVADPGGGVDMLMSSASQLSQAPDAAAKVAAAVAEPAMPVIDNTVEILPCGRVVGKPGTSPAALKAAQDIVEERKKVAMDFFMIEMGSNEAQALALLNGVDLSKPVEVVDIPPPETMSQFVRKSWGKPGNWFNPDPNQTADMLGLNGDPAIREVKTFKTPVAKALKSRSAPITDDWTDPANKVVTKGGGIQMTVSNGTRDAFGALT